MWSVPLVTRRPDSDRPAPTEEPLVNESVEITTVPSSHRVSGHRKKKVLGATVTLVALAGAAFAFWTATGTGTGTATTGDVQAVTVNQTSTITGLAPGAAAVALSGNFDNPNDAAVALTSVTGEVLTDPATGCDKAWYQIAGTGTVTDGSVPAGAGVGEWSGLTIQLVNDAAINQDACKNATVTITYTAS